MKRMHDKKEIEQISVDNLTTSDVVAKSLYQLTPNWETDVKSILDAGVVKDSTKLYAKFVQLGNVLWFVLSGIFVNGATTSANVLFINNKDVSVPDALASKIYRADGTKWTEAPTTTDTNNVFIASGTGFRITNGSNSCPVVMSSNAAKKISITVFQMGTHTEDGSYVIDIRIPLLIL